MPAAGGLCAASSSSAVKRGRGVLHAVAGGAVPVYGGLCGESADRRANAVCDRAGDVVQREVLERPGWPAALGFTFAVTYAALLRPDGALVALAFAPALLALVRGKDRSQVRGGATRMVTVCVLLAVMPFAAWTWRNWSTFHVFEPLAPRYATDPGEPTQAGWVSWVKTWCLDFISTYEVYWNVPGDTLDVSKLPARAFDSPQQYAETAALADDYNNSGEVLTPEIDARFAKLARRAICGASLAVIRAAAGGSSGGHVAAPAR